jgi:hypothetical protein
MKKQNKQTAVVHLDHLGDTARQIREAQRNASRQLAEARRQQREAEREVREATRQVREASRKMREQMKTAMPTGFGSVPDLSAWAEAARKIMESQSAYQGTSTTGQKTAPVPSQSQQAKTPDTASKKPAAKGSSFYGSKTKEDIDGQRVILINGVLSVTPDKEALAAHQQYSKAMSLEAKQRYEDSQVQFRKRAHLILKLLGNPMVVPDEALKIYVSAPSKESLAQTRFDSLGTAFICVDLDDIENHDSTLLSYFYLHEFFHLIGRYQTYSLSGSEDGLSYDQSIFKLGLETSTVTTYKVAGIQRKHWDEWASKLVEIKKGLETKSSYSYSASPKVIAMIKLCKAKFGESWLSDSIDVLKSKGNDLYKIGIWTAETKVSEGTYINETIVDTLGRLANCQNPLEPTPAEIDHLKSAGTYTNLKGINRLVTLYCGLNQVQKIELLTVMLNALQTGNAESLVKVLSQDGMNVSLDSLLKAQIPKIGDEAEDSLTSLLGSLLGLFNL